MSAQVPILVESSEDIPIVEISHILQSGAITEPEDLSGVGRIALRLLRRGAGDMKCAELDEEIDRIASVISTQSMPDYYTLHFRVLRRFLDRAVDLFSLVVNEPRLEEEELEKLKRETIAEIISSRDDDRHLASRALRKMIFEGHPYGRSSRGSLHTIPQITISHVRDFLEQHLVTQNFLIGASGHVSEEEIKGIVDRTVGKLPTDREPPKSDLTPKKKQKGIRVTLVDKPERTQTQIFMGHVANHVLDPHDMPLRVALTGFGGTFTSTLMREVRVKRGWSYGAYASAGRGRMPEVLTLYTFPSQNDAIDCLDLMINLFRDLKNNGPKEEEIIFARDFLARSFALQVDTASARLGLKLRQKHLGLPEDYYDTYRERVRKITPEQATEAVQTILDDQNFVISMACTADTLIDPLRKLLGDDAQIDVIPYDSPEL